MRHDIFALTQRRRTAKVRTAHEWASKHSRYWFKGLFQPRGDSISVLVRLWLSCSWHFDSYQNRSHAEAKSSLLLSLETHWKLQLADHTSLPSTRAIVRSEYVQLSPASIQLRVSLDQLLYSRKYYHLVACFLAAEVKPCNCVDIIQGL